MEASGPLKFEASLVYIANCKLAKDTLKIKVVKASKTKIHTMIKIDKNKKLSLGN